MLFADKMLVLARFMTNIINALLVNMVVGGKTFSDTVDNVCMSRLDEQTLKEKATWAAQLPKRSYLCKFIQNPLRCCEEQLIPL